MNRSLITFAGLSILMSSAVVACSGSGGIEGDGTDETAGRGNTATTDPIASQSDALAWRTHSRIRVRGPVSPQTPLGTAAPTATGPATAPGGTAPAASTADVVASAQTPDGRAIPQSSLPGGACPAVVAALGFWSCVTLGDACSYTAGGAAHSCTCNRVDGEGQAPAWVCN